MRDNFGRDINYLRISLTDNCNLRCIYCTPEKLSQKKEEKLLFEDLQKIIRVAKDIGIKKIRLTGGEPLLRKDLCEIIKEIKKSEIDEIYITTNGILLEEKIKDLKEAGLMGINVSLDTLDENIFNEITRGGDIKKVINGIKKSISLGLKVKINSVIIKGINEDSIYQLAEITKNNKIDVRYIELMPIGEGKKYQGLNNNEILKRLENKFGLKEYFEINGVTEYHKLKNSQGRIGFISPINNCFCKDCNKIRITSSGEIKRCLNEEGRINLKNINTEIEIKELLKNEIKNKPEKHLFGEKKEFIEKKNMNEIGG
ncbi:GTP 3',8-cyclase MoaA [Fusobacterium sp.]|uniref:GTP 3',8-cyclase MoaA n=1 Tax=Fusobacterium sp. TaxID=68766 RepID=UPI00263203C6|nr:GTP 3',8-cyclase MoaA [Fusobacterium sp.]